MKSLLVLSALTLLLSVLFIYFLIKPVYLGKHETLGYIVSICVSFC